MLIFNIVMVSDLSSKIYYHSKRRIGFPLCIPPQWRMIGNPAIDCTFYEQIVILYSERVMFLPKHH